MRFFSLLIVALTLCSAAIAAPQTHPTRITNKTRVIAGHLLVKPTTTTTSAAFAARLSARLGVTLTVTRELMMGWVLMDAAGVDDEEGTLQLVDRAAKVPGVALSAAEWVWRPFATPGDPFFEFMWHLDAIGARQAWDVTQGRTQNLVGVVDTGTAFSHEDLQGKRAREFDFIDDSFQAADGDGRDADATDVGDAADCNGDGQLDGESSFHGTHVAGTILAGGDNGVGVTGVNWNARLVTGRALGRCGGTTVDIDTAVAWMAGGFQIDGVPPLAANERPRVVNLSLGATGAPCDSFTNDIWNQVVAQGVVIVVAAGNDAAPVASPANCPASLAVAAFGPNGGNQLATYSNFGGEIDIVAPGGDQGRTGVFEDGVLSSIDPSVSPFQNREPYTFFQGTSMAAPHVAGVISLMFDVNGGLSVDDVTDLLKTASGTCTDCQGKPALRADLAVAAAAGTTVTTQPGDSCAGTLFCSPGQTCAPLNGESICQTSCDNDGDCGGGESCATLAAGGGVCVNVVAEGEGEGEGEPAGECDPRRGNLDCDSGDHCEEDDGVTTCERGEGDVGLGGLCEVADDCSTGLCDRGVCTVTCDGESCRDGYSCSDEDESDVPGGLCRADSCLDDPSICEDGFDCSYSSDERYVCAAGPSNYRGFCGSQPAAWAPVSALALVFLLLRRRRR
ncbi:MAG: S8 family serine peptidase [Deltaproteobacteria bacterium]|nr:S8 family serine peptidase [Deltaproteobacteria bacterium]